MATEPCTTLVSLRRPWYRRRRYRIAMAAAALPLAVVLGFQAAVAWWPYPEEARRPAEPSTWIVDRQESPLAIYTSAQGQWQLPLEQAQIGTHLLHAVVAVEDARFYEHHGVDWRSVAGAVWEDVASLRFRRGASTITMQLHRLRSGLSRSMAGKVAQTVRACQIEREMSKDEILVEYLNRAPFGGNLVGAGAASWRYFGKPCQMLSLGEAALLAGLPQSPNRFRPDRHPELAARRRDHVLDRMLMLGMITQQQHDEAQGEAITARWRSLPQELTQTAHADGLEPSLLALQARKRGAVIRTTIDPAVQRQAAVAGGEQLRRLAPSGVNAACVVVLDTPSARCLAVSSLGVSQCDLDLSRCPRSTGSTLKPFIYAAAFESSVVTPQSTVDDSPRAWPGYRPENFDHQWRGKMTAGEALAQSRNIPALVLLSRLGVEYTAGIMQAAGLHTLAHQPDRYGLSLAIGGAEATPMEVAQAYATLARGGRFRQATLLAEDRPSASHPCIADWACWQALEACSRPERTEPLSREAARAHVAWKTGTSSGYRDAWCAAVTPAYTVVVWLGNVDGRGADALVGVDAAAPLALQLIAALDKSPSPWPVGSRPSPAAKELTAVARPNHRGITLISPPDGLEVISTGQSQQLSLQARLTGTAQRAVGERLWWFVDGELIGSADSAQQVWWSPTAGSHRITVATLDGESAAARVSVR